MYCFSNLTLIYFITFLSSACAQNTDLDVAEALIRYDYSNRISLNSLEPLENTVVSFASFTPDLSFYNRFNDLSGHFIDPETYQADDQLYGYQTIYFYKFSYSSPALVVVTGSIEYGLKNYLFSASISNNANVWQVAEFKRLPDILE